MQIILHNDDTIHGFAEAEAYVRETLLHELKSFADGLTRAEVWLADENAQKGGPDDKRCTIEVRPEHLKPLSVTHHAPDIKLAVRGAAAKLYKVLEREFRGDERWRRKSGSAG